MTVALKILGLVSLPVATMIAGGLLVYLYSPGPKLSSAFQHFAAGIIIAALAVELVPEARERCKGDAWAVAAAVGGFVGGTLLMMILAEVCDAHDDEDDGHGHGNGGHGGHGQGNLDQYDSELGTKEQKHQSPVHQPNERTLLVDRHAGMQHDVDRSMTTHNPRPHHGGRAARYQALQRRESMRRLASMRDLHAELPSKKPSSEGTGLSLLPWPLVVAVAVDGFMDGTTIGIATAAGKEAGAIMAFALMIEMGFLGISTGTALRNTAGVPTWLAVTTSCVLPLMIAVGGLSSFTVMTKLSGPAFVAVLAFCIASLLYMVVEELLTSAHKNEDVHTWYVSVQLFAGFILVVLLELLQDI